MIRVLIAEDQSMVLGALAALLDMENDIEVVARATDGENALRLATEHKPDVVVADIEMPRVTGLELAAALHKREHPARVIIVTTFARPGYLRRALDAGVKGYMLKEERMFFDNGYILLETFTVGTLAYIALVLLLRFSGKRTLSKWNAFDLMVTVAFGSTLATAFLSKTTSLVQAILAFALLVSLQWMITWLSVRSRLVERWVKAEPTLLLFEGQLRLSTLQRERVTESEVRAAARTQGVSALEDLEAVVLETDGSFSIIKQRGSSLSALVDVEGYSLTTSNHQQAG